MSLKQKVRLEYELDGEEQSVEAVYSAIDLRAWETKFGKSALTEDMSVSMLTWVTWNAAVRQGLINGKLKDWRTFDAACVSVEGVSADAETPTPQGETPTQQTAGDEPSAP